jgi:uncharacterized membrane protein YfhO
VPRRSLADSINALPSSEAMLSTQSFAPDRFSFSITNSSPGYYVLLQNNFPHWTLQCDGTPVVVDQVDRSFMGFRIPAGKHLITFMCQVPGLVAACYLNVVAGLIVFLVAVWPRPKVPENHSNPQ